MFMLMFFFFFSMAPFWVAVRQPSASAVLVCFTISFFFYFFQWEHVCGSSLGWQSFISHKEREICGCRRRQPKVTTRDRRRRRRWLRWHVKCLNCSWEWRIMIACLIGVFFFWGGIFPLLGSSSFPSHSSRYRSRGSFRKRLWVCLLWWKIIDAIVIVTHWDGRTIPDQRLS